jgi:hypothetical protein
VGFEPATARVLVEVRARVDGSVEVAQPERRSGLDWRLGLCGSGRCDDREKSHRKRIQPAHVCLRNYLGDELGASIRSNSREAWASWFPVRNLYPFSWCLYGPVSRFGFTAENAENAENPGNRTAFFFFFLFF